MSQPNQLRSLILSLIPGRKMDILRTLYADYPIREIRPVLDSLVASATIVSVNGTWEFGVPLGPPDHPHILPYGLPEGYYKV